MGTNDFTWGVRYWSINALDVDPTLETSWSEAVFIVESELDAHDLFAQYELNYATNPDVRNLQIVKFPKIQWIVEKEGAW